MWKSVEYILVFLWAHICRTDPPPPANIGSRAPWTFTNSSSGVSSVALSSAWRFRDFTYSSTVYSSNSFHGWGILPRLPRSCQRNADPFTAFLTNGMQPVLSPPPPVTFLLQTGMYLLIPFSRTSAILLGGNEIDSVPKPQPTPSPSPSIYRRPPWCQMRRGMTVPSWNRVPCLYVTSMQIFFMRAEHALKISSHARIF